MGKISTGKLNTLCIQKRMVNNISGILMKHAPMNMLK